MVRPKIGAVSYLNTKPLVEGLADSASDFELVYDVPSSLADRLSAGELEVGLIPVIEAVTHPDYTIVSDACIGCQGPVWSVKLMSRVPGEQIKTLALDEGSRTSCALTRVLLSQKFGVQPECQPLALAHDWRSSACDAVLIIGDRAMDAEDQQFPFAWDLGEVWNQWTGKPFVFAVWAAHPSCDSERLKRLDQVLSAARDLGLESIESIAAHQAPKYGLSDADCLKYLRHHLHFDLGPEEKSGMDLFFQYAAQLSLIPEPLQLQFHDCQTAG